MRIEISHLANVLGKELAHSDDEVQSNLLNAFAYELNVSCGRFNKAETQLCYLSDKLDRAGMDMILALADFIKLRRGIKL